MQTTHCCDRSTILLLASDCPGTRKGPSSLAFSDGEQSCTSRSSSIRSNGTKSATEGLLLWLLLGLLLLIRWKVLLCRLRCVVFTLLKERLPGLLQQGDVSESESAHPCTSPNTKEGLLLLSWWWALSCCCCSSCSSCCRAFLFLPSALLALLALSSSPSSSPSDWGPLLLLLQTLSAPLKCSTGLPATATATASGALAKTLLVAEFEADVVKLELLLLLLLLLLLESELEPEWEEAMEVEVEGRLETSVPLAPATLVSKRRFFGDADEETAGLSAVSKTMISLHGGLKRPKAKSIAAALAPSWQGVGAICIFKELLLGSFPSSIRSQREGES
mmetsp:Transcript_7256/g.16030  ORF Transcript_7256/g.16030 Transcript_7256/m.16030 type:complete len:333 (-) Transcript_7256:42-1040(-)